MMTDDAIILDVRTQEEFDEGYIANAVLLPYTEISEKAASFLPDKDQTVLIYCRAGRRSEIAARELIDMGYTKVYDFGGIQDWTDGLVKPFDINFTATRRIHEQMPEWTFSLRGKKVEEYYDYGNSHINEITIRDNSGAIIQVLADLYTGLPFASEDNMYGLVFGDWNFDGYLDIGLWMCPGGSMRNNPHYYWLWDNDSGSFIQNEQLEVISKTSTISINTDMRRLESYTRISSLEHVTVYYEYKDGDFSLVGATEKFYREIANDEYAWHVVVSKYINGEWVVVEEYYEDLD
jgi:rhodanese-related sulfurtransferase